MCVDALCVVLKGVCQSVNPSVLLMYSPSFVSFRKVDYTSSRHHQDVLAHERGFNLSSSLAEVFGVRLHTQEVRYMNLRQDLVSTHSRKSTNISRRFTHHCILIKTCALFRMGLSHIRDKSVTPRHRLPLCGCVLFCWLFHCSRAKKSSYTAERLSIGGRNGSFPP